MKYPFTFHKNAAIPGTFHWYSVAGMTWKVSMEIIYIRLERHKDNF